MSDAASNPASDPASNPTGTPAGNPVVVVVGVGPGVGASVARRYARAAYDVGLVGRDQATLTHLGQELQTDGTTAGWCDAEVTDPAALAEAVEQLGSHGGRIDVLHFNPSAFRGKDLMELTVPELLADVALGVGGLLTAAQAARPFMGSGARITATGSAAADRPSADAATLGVQKAGLRNLVRSLDRALRPAGIRAASVTVNGVLRPADPSSPFHPDQVAEALFAAAHQDETAWRTEVAYPAAASP
ncbi:MAG: Short-chain dehydrogenase/reductase SDR? [uncultured Nocardioidaceae bacterium]|uniref:Short-chain dehydrogenase/reductase SDR n=1 Tax=uncultured Nocardioidaceae bacterium TaxID=253824 RepID=A0A6J4MCE9_9ACTN|nr:MAG: Short-chain dehydrogenase/reductase SDR? [uncultured Nocardioidaceae bacterium]